jgi:hypothetical protein
MVLAVEENGDTMAKEKRYRIYFDGKYIMTIPSPYPSLRVTDTQVRDCAMHSGCFFTYGPGGHVKRMDTGEIIGHLDPDTWEEVRRRMKATIEI